MANANSVVFWFQVERCPNFAPECVVTKGFATETGETGPSSCITELQHRSCRIISDLADLLFSDLFRMAFTFTREKSGPQNSKSQNIMKNLTNDHLPVTLHYYSLMLG